MRLGIAFLFFLALLSACATENTEQLQPLSLLQYGLPITILAPDSAEVKSVDMGILKDVTITGEENYAVQIIASRSLNSDMKGLVGEQLAEVKKNPFFSKVVEEEDNGFIFENAIDSTRTNYGFRYIHLAGEQELIIQNGLMGIFSRAEIDRMYRAVHPQPVAK
ncbi:MAG: hypothetical protein AAFW73_17495 [Bacteroidota bacterium]